MVVNILPHFMYLWSFHQTDPITEISPTIVNLHFPMYKLFFCSSLHHLWSISIFYCRRTHNIVASRRPPLSVPRRKCSCRSSKMSGSIVLSLFFGTQTFFNLYCFLQSIKFKTLLQRLNYLTLSKHL